MSEPANHSPSSQAVALAVEAGQLQATGRVSEAIELYRRALQLSPGFPAAWNNLGVAHRILGQLRDSVAACRRAVELQPTFAEAWTNLGNSWKDLGQSDAAIAAYRQALQLQPRLFEAWNNLGNVLKDTGQIDEAIVAYDRALEISPASASPAGNRCLAEHYLPGVTLERLQAVHDDWERRLGLALRATWQPFTNSRDPERPLRLGFISPDLGQHPVGYLLTRNLAAIDQREFPVYCYSHRKIQDPVAGKLESLATVWRNVWSLADQELAECIRGDEIDILFDLAGHTAGNRMTVLARKPAPVQASWIGYVGPSGLAATEYLIADRWLVSDAMLPRIRERVVRLPTVWASFELPYDAPPSAPSPALLAGQVIFGSFNNPAKLNPPVIAAWSQILRRVPNSRLLLKYRGLSEPGVQQRFRTLFAQQGIDPARVEFQGSSEFRQMLEIYNSTIDIALDPFPFNGGTMSLIALWLGVPVITFPGDTLSGRQSYALLKTLGIDETIGSDEASYIERAVALASDLPRLAELRQRLRPAFAASPLCDGPRLAREFSDAIRELWRERVQREW